MWGFRPRLRRQLRSAPGGSGVPAPRGGWPRGQRCRGSIAFGAVSEDLFALGLGHWWPIELVFRDQRPDLVFEKPLQALGPIASWMAPLQAVAALLESDHHCASLRLAGHGRELVHEG